MIEEEDTKMSRREFWITFAVVVVCMILAILAGIAVPSGWWIG